MSNSKLHDMSDSKYAGIEHRVFKLYLKNPLQKIYYRIGDHA